MMLEANFSHIQEDVLSFRKDIQSSSGCIIELVEDESVEHSSCRFIGNKVEIKTPSYKYLTTASLYHELMHAYSYLIEEIPHVSYEGVECQNRELQEFVTSFDNCLEHLVIVPKEIDKFPEREAYWIKKLSDIPDSGGIEVYALIVNYLFVRHVFSNNHELVNKYEDALSKNNSLDAAHKLYELISKNINNKEFCFKAFWNAMEYVEHIPFKNFVLQHSRRGEIQFT
jgi:hypothetical protein